MQIQTSITDQYIERYMNLKKNFLVRMQEVFEYFLADKYRTRIKPKSVVKIQYLKSWVVGCAIENCWTLYYKLVNMDSKIRVYLAPIDIMITSRDEYVFREKRLFGTEDVETTIERYSRYCFDESYVDVVIDSDNDFEKFESIISNKISKYLHNCLTLIFTGDKSTFNKHQIFSFSEEQIKPILEANISCRGKISYEHFAGHA